MSDLLADMFQRDFILGKAGRSVVVIGDVMLDEYITCDVLGHSPEDELAPKLRICGEASYKLGGAANVAHNLAKLGLEVHLHGCTGDDAQNLQLLVMLRDAGVQCELSLSDSPTIVKTRYMTRKGRQAVRVDRERMFVGRCEQRMSLLEALPNVGLYVVSDYGKGTVDQTVMAWLAKKGARCIVDPKRNDFEFYGCPELITPNENELNVAFPREPDLHAKLLAAGRSARAVLVTRGIRGSVLRAGDRVRAYSVREREVGDPAGCGDSVIAGVAFGLANDWSLEDACALGNACGACAMDHVGVNAVNPPEVLEELRSFDYRRSSDFEGET